MTRHRSLAGLLAVLAVPVLVAACSSGGAGVPTIPPATPTPAATEAPAESPVPATEVPVAGVPEGCPTTQPDPLPAGETRTVTMQTDKGEIAIRIEADLSPIAAGNFVALADCGWYDGVIFHRLVPGFVIQGGDGQYGRVPNVDPALVGTGGPPYTIQDEVVTAKYARGVVAMARTSAPNSVGSQFFIILDDGAEQALAAYNTYQIIGSVTSGMEAVDAIAAMPNSGQPANAALEPVPMTDVTVANP